MALTPEQQRARLAALFKSQGKSESEIGEALGPPPGGPDQDYVMAPYRFVELRDVVLPPPEEVANLAQKAGDGGLQNKPLKNGYSGRITVTWEAETPILIGERRDKNDYEGPMRIGTFEKADWWIPGSSFRGMLRSACDIVGFARLSQVNKHHVFPFRDFTRSDYKIDENIQAGWVFRGTGTYPDSDLPVVLLQPCRLHYAKIDDLQGGKFIFPDLLPIDKKTKVRPPWRQGKIADKYSAANVNLALGVAAQKSQAFPVTIRDRERPSISGGSVKGRLVLSDYAPKPNDPQLQKQYEYVFEGDPDKSKAVEIPFEDALRFHLVNTAPGRNKRNPIASWALFHPHFEAGLAVPVFFTGDPKKPGDAKKDGNRFAFGLTRMFKLPHKYSVGDKVDMLTNHRLQRGEGYTPDMVEALFGYVHEPRDYAAVAGKALNSHPLDHLKGRVAFSGARIPFRDAVESDQITTVMAAPRASFAPFYLKGPVKDWSNAEAKLAGRKRYSPRTLPGGQMQALELLKQRLKRQIPEGNAGENRSTQSRLKFLCASQPTEKLAFSSCIDVHNVSLEELGLLLFALTHNGDRGVKYRHMMGRAKPFGAGQMRVASVSLAGVTPNFATAPAADISGCLKAYRTYVEAAAKAHDAKETLGPDADLLEDLEKCGPILDFLASSDPANGHKLPFRWPKSDSPKKDPDLWQDNYLRLKYANPVCEPDGKKQAVDRNGELKFDRPNPYYELRRATRGSGAGTDWAGPLLPVRKK